MKKNLKKEINAIENAGTWLLDIDIFSQLPASDLRAHHKLGQIMYDHAEEVVKFLLSIEKKNKS